MPSKQLKPQPHKRAGAGADERSGGSLADYERSLRDAGQLFTVQRRAILRYLLRHGDHPTTAQIAAGVGRAGAASLATVYNNLALFAKLRLVSVARTPDGELRWDLRIDPHHHLSCPDCGRVVDIDVTDAEVVVPDPKLRRRVQRTEVWLIGPCESCAKDAA